MHKNQISQQHDLKTFSNFYSKELKREHTPDVEVIESDQAGEKHSLMNINVKGIKKTLAALKMFNELRPSPSFIVVTETWNQDLDQAQIAGKFAILFKVVEGLSTI